MPTQVQLRRGTTAEHSSFTGAAGEVTVDTTKKTVVVHDGSTAGGMPLLPKTMSDGTANGVTYLNGSKVLTSGSALVFDGTNLGIGTSSPVAKLEVVSVGVMGRFKTGSASDGRVEWAYNTTDIGYIGADSSTEFSVTARSGNALKLGAGGTERARITSAGNLGVGTTDEYGRVNIQRFTSAPQSTLAIGDFATVTNDVGIYLRTTGTAGISTAGGPIAFYRGGPGTTESARIDSSGNFGVGRGAGGDTTVGATLYTTGVITCARSSSSNSDLNLYVYSTGATAARFYVGMGGTVYATNTTISAISDQRFKENIQDLDVGLDKIMALKPRKFDWKAGKGKDIKGDRGFIAQELEQVFPDLVDEWADPAPEGEEPYKSVRQDLIPVLVKAIQELKADLDATKAELAALKGA
jgi:hypothetical protein